MPATNHGPCLPRAHVPFERCLAPTTQPLPARFHLIGSFQICVMPNAPPTGPPVQPVGSRCPDQFPIALGWPIRWQGRSRLTPQTLHIGTATGGRGREGKMAMRRTPSPTHGELWNPTGSNGDAATCLSPTPCPPDTPARTRRLSGNRQNSQMSFFPTPTAPRGPPSTASRSLPLAPLPTKLPPGRLPIRSLQDLRIPVSQQFQT